MPPTLADRLVHILTAIDAIQTMLARKTLEDFAADFTAACGRTRS